MPTSGGRYGSYNINFEIFNSFVGLMIKKKTIIFEVKKIILIYFKMKNTLKTIFIIL
jgi:hypothetical protein